MILAVAVPLLISFTRLYLGVHFPTDIFLGLALGWGFAIAGAMLGDRVVSMLVRWNLRSRVIIAAAVSLGMNALHMADTSLSGVFLGTAIGAAFLFDRLPFSASSGGLGRKAARLGVGLAGLVALYAGGKLLSPAEGASLYGLARFVRYGLLGAWVSYGGPWLFLKLRLADPRPAKE
jgi:hypothetical protein